MKTIFFLLITIILYSCADPDKGEILYFDANKGEISYKVVKLPAIVDISELKSKYFNFLAGGKISAFVSTDVDENSLTVDDYNKLTYQKKGVTPGFRYQVQDDAIIPYTLKDTILLTLYYNMNSAMEFFVSLGLPLDNGANGDSWGIMDVFFELNMVLPNADGDPESMKDNAFYYPLMKIMAFLELDVLKHLAMAANPMVVTHEFAHSIFDFYAVGRVPGNKLVLDTVPESTCKAYTSAFYQSGFNEGFSDYWGSLHVGRSDVIYLSVTKEELGVKIDPTNERGLENNRILTSRMLIRYLSCEDDLNTKSYYWGGTIWASSLWEINKLNIDNFNPLVLKSYSCLHDYFQSKRDVTYALPGNCLVKTLKENNVTRENINKVCTILKRRFSIIAGELNECN